MKVCTKHFREFIADEGGATLVEYGVALLVVIVVGAGAVATLGDTIASELEETSSAF